MNSTEADPLSPKRLLIPAPDEVLLVQPASPRANSAKNDGPQLIIAT